MMRIVALRAILAAMKILFVSSEVAPFAKAGGLGDVSAALPRQLAALGHDVRVVMPLYARVRQPGRAFTEVMPDVTFTMGPREVRFSVAEAPLPGTRVPVYFVRCPSLFDRPELYGSGEDEHLRFGVLSWVSLLICQHLKFAPDIAHVNDWQSALVPLLLRSLFAWDRLFAETRSVLTIHNLGHQGTFGAHAAYEVGLGPALNLVHGDHLAAGRFGFLLSGILHANAITTVSPTYAREIQTPAHGVGLDPFLRARRDALFGILNGIDEAEWSPEVDRYLEHPYSAYDLTNKELCKRDLVRSMALPYRPEAPVLGLVTRLVWQKGLDLCMGVLPRVLRTRGAQLVALGKGEPKYEWFFRSLMKVFPKQVAFQAAFSEERAHAIEAGADLFLMPSRYEPCGLNQMYSLRYGTPPVVHRTGGLADSVRPFVPPDGGSGTGFVFNDFDESGFAWALNTALDTWISTRGEHREHWRALQRRGMAEPLGWQHRIGEYLDVYRFVAPGRE
ncbi:MAG: glycogen synthase [Myxococcales bacterium]